MTEGKNTDGDKSPKVNDTKRTKERDRSHDGRNRTVTLPKLKFLERAKYDTEFDK